MHCGHLVTVALRSPCYRFIAVTLLPVHCGDLAVTSQFGSGHITLPKGSTEKASRAKSFKRAKSGMVIGSRIGSVGVTRGKSLGAP